jgi:acyl carrier protein
MTTDAEAVVRTAIAGIAPEADLDLLDPDEDMPDALDLDSMDFLNVLVAIRDATGIEIPERDTALVRTYRGCVDYVRARLPAA